MKVAALGRTHWLRDTIQAVAAAGHEIVLIGTSAPSPEYRAGPEDFERLAKVHGCPFFHDPRLDDPPIEKALRGCGADVAVSVNWTRLIPAPLLDAFPHGMLNAHAGALPRYRGNAAPNWAILQGEKEVVLTIHCISAELDAGPILLQEPFPLTDETYIADVYAFLETAIPRMFVAALAGLADGSIVPRPQSTDPADALRGLPRRPEDGRIDWSRQAEKIARLVRASAEPFAGAFAFLGGERLTIWRARAATLPYRHLGIPGQVVALRRKAGEVDVLTGDGVLVLETVESGHGGRVPATDVIRSTRSRLAPQPLS